MSKVSFYAGAEYVMSEFLGLTAGQKLEQKSTSRKVRSVVGTGGAAAMLEEMYEVMTSKPGLNPEKSRQNWRLERQIDQLDDGHTGKETCLEKAVAFLAENGRMPGWYNQVPTASGVTDPSQDRKANVDLAHWDESRGILRLVELKWESNAPSYALYEAIKSGLAYIYFRAERIRRPMLELRPRHVALEVVAPHVYFVEHDQQALLREISEALAPFAKSKIGEDAPDMSVNMLAFPSDFITFPFENGAEVKAQCNTAAATPEGRRVCEAFANLSPVWK